MNNRGQVLVLFVLILPFILTAFVYLIDVTYQQVQHQQISNQVNLAVDYYFQEKTIASLDEIEESFAPNNLKIKHSSDQITLIINYEITVIFGENKLVTKVFTGEKKAENIVIREGFENGD